MATPELLLISPGLFRVIRVPSCCWLLLTCSWLFLACSWLRPGCFQAPSGLFSSRSSLINQPVRRDYAPHEVSWRQLPSHSNLYDMRRTRCVSLSMVAPGMAHSVLKFYGYVYAPDPMRRETLCGATPVA